MRLVLRLYQIPIEKLMLYTIDPDDQQELIIANEKMKMKLSDDEYEKVIGWLILSLDIMQF